MNLFFWLTKFQKRHGISEYFSPHLCPPAPPFFFWRRWNTSWGRGEKVIWHVLLQVNSNFSVILLDVSPQAFLLCLLKCHRIISRFYLYITLLRDLYNLCLQKNFSLITRRSGNEGLSTLPPKFASKYFLREDRCIYCLHRHALFFLRLSAVCLIC